jgi:hypothetical protein
MQAEGDRINAIDMLERDKCALARAEIRMTPGRGL